MANCELIVPHCLEYGPAHDGQKLVRLIRKVKHVLMVKHCIDRIKDNTSAQYSLGRVSQSLGDDLAGHDASLAKPSLGAVLPDNGQGILEKLSGVKGVSKKRKLSTSTFISKQVSGVSAQSLCALEIYLDTFISQASAWVRDCRNEVGRRIGALWKRCKSVKDKRSKAMLIKLCHEVGHLKTVEKYLDTYEEEDDHWEPQSVVVTWLRSVFGIGWFFEWPGGRHPLNSTWPWADVKPSLVVLWGVCWMFYDSHLRGLMEERSRLIQSSNQSPALPLQWLASWPEAGYNMGQNQLQPSRYPVIAQQDLQQFLNHTMLNGMSFHNPGYESHGSNPSPSPSAGPLTYDATTCNQSHSAQYQAATSTRQPPINHHEGLSDFDFSCNSGTQSVRQIPNVAQHTSLNPDYRAFAPAPALNLNFSPKAENYHAIHRRDYSLPHQSNTREYPAMPSSAENHFSYPPLDGSMGVLHDSQPYLTQEVRDFQLQPDPREYEQHHNLSDQQRYPSPTPVPSENPYHTHQNDGTADNRLSLAGDNKTEFSDPGSPGRTKPVPKPLREITKDANGRYYCNWPNCTEEVKDFGRKCEWGKHMDKHDRPYKCPADGCEKLPGFTYSGGLLRHEREVHNKHGGPRKQLNCPHLNCKRHTGKGFSRQENLNEHLRRVHTTENGMLPTGEETEDDAVEAQAGQKRKRLSGRSESEELREQMKRLRQENDELRRQVEAQSTQTNEMMRQIHQLGQTQQLQANMQPRMQAPPAQMI